MIIRFGTQVAQRTFWIWQILFLISNRVSSIWSPLQHIHRPSHAVSIVVVELLLSAADNYMILCKNNRKQRESRATNGNCVGLLSRNKKIQPTVMMENLMDFPSCYCSAVYCSTFASSWRTRPACGNKGIKGNNTWRKMCAECDT